MRILINKELVYGDKSKYTEFMKISIFLTEDFEGVLQLRKRKELTGPITHPVKIFKIADHSTGATGHNQ